MYVVCPRLAERTTGTANEWQRQGEEEAGHVESGERSENGDYQLSHATATATALVATVGIEI